MRTWLLLDVEYICWRSYFSTGYLSYGGEDTGTVFGFFIALRDLQRLFMTKKLVFTFGHGQLLRETEVTETYKANRKDETDPAKRAARAKVKRGIEQLKTKFLRRVGYRNVLFQGGYEADDVIAAAVPAVRARGDRAVIVTGDKDMYQLLEHDRVLVYHPREQKTVTARSFSKKYGVTPEGWKFVKAIGGCGGDFVKGVPGCREKTALAYMTGKLPKKDARFKAIESEAGKKATKRNLKLVSLPYPGAKPVVLKKDVYDPEAFDGLCEELGFGSLMGNKPRGGFKL